MNKLIDDKAYQSFKKSSLKEGDGTLILAAGIIFDLIIILNKKERSNLETIFKLDNKEEIIQFFDDNPSLVGLIVDLDRLYLPLFHMIYSYDEVGETFSSEENYWIIESSATLIHCWVEIISESKSAEEREAIVDSGDVFINSLFKNDE